MKFIGLLMINGEDDILLDTLAANTPLLDAFYVLDGTEPNTVSQRICAWNPKCKGYTQDRELLPPYPANPVDGYRQHLYEQAVDRYGYDNWFLLLHGDEVWTFDPRDIIEQAPEADGFTFLLPFYFPRAGECWDDNRSPIEQLLWSLGPGFPEFRMFRGNPDVRFDPNQHNNVTPQGLRNRVNMHAEIRHYLYRSPANQRARARRHSRNGFSPDNYRRIIEDDAVYWSDEMIAKVQNDPAGFFTDLRCDEVTVVG